MGSRNHNLRGNSLKRAETAWIPLLTSFNIVVITKKVYVKFGVNLSKIVTSIEQTSIYRKTQGIPKLPFPTLSHEWLRVVKRVIFSFGTRCKGKYFLAFGRFI